MSNKESNIEKTNFDAFIQAVGSEIEQAQVRLIVAANAQMLFHYWKVGNYILYHQQLHGWGSKIIKQLAKAIRLHYPEKKGYSERNLCKCTEQLFLFCTYRKPFLQNQLTLQ